MKSLGIFLFLFSAKVIFGFSPHAYVTDQHGSSVQVLDLNAFTVQKIFGFENPRVVKVSYDGREAYVGEAVGRIRVIDTITHTILPVILNINNPLAIAISPDNDFFAVVSNDETVSVVRISDFSVQTVLTGFTSPHDIKFSPNGMTAYVTNRGNGTVSVIRTSDWTITNTISGMKNPKGITLTNDGSFAYVTDTELGVLYQLKLSDNTLIATVQGFSGPEYLAMTPDDNFLYVSNIKNSTVSKMRLRDNQILTSFNLPFPKSIAISPDGSYLLVGSTFGMIFQIRTLDHVISAAYPAGLGDPDPSNIALTSNNPPQVSLNGCQDTDASGNIHNHITWLAAPGDPVKYKLYRDVQLNHLAAELPSDALEFDDTDLKPGQTYWYYLIAVYDNGFSSEIGNIVVNPQRTCLGGI